MNTVFKQRLKGLIDDLGISHRQFCMRFNEFEPVDIKLSPSTLSNVLQEQNDRAIRSELIPKLSRVFNVSTDYLFGLTDIRTMITTEKEKEMVKEELRNIITNLNEAEAIIKKYYDSIEELE